MSLSVTREWRPLMQGLDELIGRWAIMLVHLTDSQDATREILESSGHGLPAPSGQTVALTCPAIWLQDDFDVGTTTMSRMTQAGVFVKLSKNTYDYRQSVKNYVKEIRRQAATRGTSSYHDERARKTAIQREHAELDLAMRKRQLVLADEVRRQLEEIFSMIRDKLLQASTRASSVEAQIEIETIVRGILTELAGIDVDVVADRAGGDPAASSRAAKRERVGKPKPSTKRQDKRGARSVAKRKDAAPD